MSNDDNGLCCCCIGLAIGYLLWHQGPAHGTELQKSKNNLEEVAIVETSGSESKQDNFVLRQIHRYQEDIGPRMKARIGREDICRYEPSCSEYARQAIEKHGQVKGSLMTAGRLVRCNPLSNGGYDPVN